MIQKKPIGKNFSGNPGRSRIRVMRAPENAQQQQPQQPYTNTQTALKRRSRPFSALSQQGQGPRGAKGSSRHLKQKRNHKDSPGFHKSQGGRDRGPRRQSQQSRDEKQPPVPPIEKGVLRIIPLGGVEEVGRNMTAIEYENDIVIVDAGLQFSEVETPGIDYMLPNPGYLAQRKEKIRGIFITHGHYDHIGAIPHIMEDIGNPPVYTREFGALIIQKRQTEFTSAPPLNIRTVRGDEHIKIGTDFSISFFAISHTIPDSMGILIDTPLGTVAFIEDVRVDHVNGIPTQKEIDHYKQFKDKEILLFTLDSTSIEKPGFSIPETAAVNTIDKIMQDVAGRLIIGSFASNVERIIQFVNLAVKYNKLVAVDGRSMKSNLEIVKQLKLVKTDNLIPVEAIHDYPPNKIVVIATGAQGEEYAVFDRIANKTHRHITLNRSDTVVFSSSAVPGNEMAIQKLKDNLYRQEAKIITYTDSTVHASGHGNRDELGWIHSQIKYRYFIPLHGHHYMLRIHAELSESLGTPRENIVVPDNGSIIEISDGGKKISVRKEKAPSNPIVVDGFSVGHKQEVVLRDRQTLAEDGIFVVVVSLNPQTGKLRKSPDIISRGFVYLKEQQELIEGARGLVKRSVEKTTHGMRPINFDLVKTVVTDDVRRFLLQKTGKSPIVIPVVIGI